MYISRKLNEPFQRFQSASGGSLIFQRWERVCSSPYNISRSPVPIDIHPRSDERLVHRNVTFRKSKIQLPRKMSAQNVMASIGLTLGNRDSKPPAPNEIRFAGDERRKDKLYEPKHKQKLVRVLTVVAYVIFVSMAAILLSLYYTFVWNPKDQAVRKLRIEKSDCAKFPSLDLLTIPPIFNGNGINQEDVFAPIKSRRCFSRED